MDPTDLSAQIGSVAQNPASASGDAGSFSAQPIDALIAADRYLAAKVAMSRNHRGLRFSRLRPANPLIDRSAPPCGSQFPSGV